jgi:hypothetical protein
MGGDGVRMWRGLDNGAGGGVIQRLVAVLVLLDGFVLCEMRFYCMLRLRMMGLWVVVGVALVGVVGCGHAGAPVPSQPVAAMAPDAGGAAGGVREIHVDQDCVILQDVVDGVRGVMVPGAEPVAGGAVGQSDRAVCHLESQLSSNHVQGAVVNGAVQRSVVVVKEQEYLLQDEFQQPVVFVVEQAVPEGWVVDSDPQPAKVVGHTALFRVMAQPGQIVRLHVGVAHTIPLAS